MPTRPAQPHRPCLASASAPTAKSRNRASEYKPNRNAAVGKMARYRTARRAVTRSYSRSLSRYRMTIAASSAPLETR
jgi:hypothetical protein